MSLFDMNLSDRIRYISEEAYSMSRREQEITQLVNDVLDMAMDKVQDLIMREEETEEDEAYNIGLCHAAEEVEGLKVK